MESIFVPSPSHGKTIQDENNEKGEEGNNENSSDLKSSRGAADRMILLCVT